MALAVTATLGSACSASSSGTAAATTPSQSSAATQKPPHATPSTVQSTPTIVVESPSPKVVGGQEHQWAKSATATSNYGANPGDSWNSSQATGAPNATCSDDEHAWASLESNTVETLTVAYADSVIPSMVRVVQSDNPGHVSKVVVSGSGKTAEVYSNPDAAAVPGGQPCVTLEIPINAVSFAIDTVAVTVDQTKVGNWAEIDAVELIGKPA